MPVSVAIRPAQQRINHAFGRMPYGAHVFRYLDGSMSDAETLTLIASNLEKFAERLTEVAETNRTREEELTSLNREIAAAGKLLRRIMKLA